VPADPGWVGGAFMGQVYFNTSGHQIYLWGSGLGFFGTNWYKLN
jgi:hypothetical protein